MLYKYLKYNVLLVKREILTIENARIAYCDRDNLNKW